MFCHVSCSFLKIYFHLQIADCVLRGGWWTMNNEGFSVFSAMTLADAVYRNRATLYIKTDKNQQEERIPLRRTSSA
jgi:hypothetical protein